MATPPSIHTTLNTVFFAAALTLSTEFNALADPQSMDTFGVNEHFLRYDDYQASADELIAAGVTWARIGSDWGTLETSRGVYDQARLNKLDALINQLSNNGVNVLFVLGYTAPWASSQPGLPWPDVTRYKPASWTDWESFVEFVATRYSGKIKHWEVWNEPDHSGFWKSSIDDYHLLLQKAAAKIRAAHPENKVLVGGLALYNGSNDWYGIGSFFDQLLEKGAASSFDIINYHAYGSSSRFKQLYEGMRSVIAKYSLQNRRIWITETGYSTAGDITLEPTKADRVDQTALTHSNLPGIDRLFWYVCRNITPIGNPSEENFGLEANDRTPLKAFAYYQAEAGATTSFALQKTFPVQTAQRRTLVYVPATIGDGSFVRDEISDGSTKRIPAGTYMYFRVHDNWIQDSNAGLDSEVAIGVTYWEGGAGACSLQYDGSSGAYSNISKAKSNIGRWITQTFVIDDALFANRQNNGADFRLYAAGADLIVANVTVNRRMNMAKAVLGNVDRFRLMERADEPNPAHMGYAPATTMGGASCRALSSASKYLCFRVCDGLIAPEDSQLEIGVEFWDAGTDGLVLRYNALGGIVDKGITIQKTNTNTWRYVTRRITDANFRNAMSYSADICLNTGSDNLPEYIRSVNVHLTNIKAALGGADKFRLITNRVSSDPTQENYAPADSIGEEECRRISGNSNYLYFQVGDNFVRPETTNVTIKIRYWDGGADKLLLQYNATGNSYKGLTIAKTSTNTWKTAKLVLSDANFRNTQNYFADFRISNSWDSSQEYISSVEVSVP